MASAVSVLVMDCTTTGASPPIMTVRSPHFTATERVARRGAAPTEGGGASWQGREESCIGETGIYLDSLGSQSNASHCCGSQPCQKA